MSELLIEGLKVAGLLVAWVFAVMLVWAVVVGAWRAVTGESKRRSDAVSKAWVEGWNAAMRGATSDADEWARRMERELDR